MQMRYAVKEDIQHISNEELSKVLSLLPEWRREKALRFKFTLGQVECAFSYLMLCDLGTSRNPFQYQSLQKCYSCCRKHRTYWH